MNQTFHRLSALLLSIALLMLAGCTPAAPGQEDAGPDADTAKGRYLEAQRPLPEGIGYIPLLHQDEAGDLIVIANYNTENTLGPYGMWRSGDGGLSWQKESAPWLEQIEDTHAISSLTYAPGSGYYMIASHTDPAILELWKHDPDAVPDDYRDEMWLYHGNENGLTQLSFEVPLEDVYGYEVPPSGFGTLPNGDLVFLFYTTLLQVDPQTGATKQTYEFERGMAFDGTYTAYENTLALYEVDSIRLYDINTGEFLGETTNTNEASTASGQNVIISGDSYGSAIGVSADGEFYFICDSSGIYRTMADGVVLERLLDGELSSLNMPSMYVAQLFVQPDNSFFVLGKDNSMPVLFYYYYDAEASSVPSTQLTVYSLEDNSTIRQAMGAFQRKHPEVKVVYTVGLAGDDGITASDAMRTLSTELIAGSGPDIIVLDSMPTNSYIQQDILLDLSELLDSDIRSGKLLEHVSQTFRTQRGLYAVPARFTVPMYTGPADGAQAADNLTVFADWLLRQTDPRMSYSSGSALLSQYYNLYAPLWFDNAGTVNTQALAQSLSDIQRMTEISGIYSTSEEDTVSHYYYNTLSDSVMWASDNTTAAVNELAGLDDVAAADAAIKKIGGGAFVPMGNGQGSVFVPRTILGVNAGTPLRELALEFVQLTLSEEVQTLNFSDGLPVNTASLAANAVSPYSEDDDGAYYGFAFHSEEDGIIVQGDLHVIWPDDAFMEEVIAAISRIETPSLPNAVVKQIVFDEASGYFRGTRSLDDTVSGIEQKVNLYLAEQG